MNRSAQVNPLFDRLLTRWGGSYVLRMQSLAQLLSFLAAAFGVYYILITAHFTSLQTRQLIACVLILVIIVNLLLPVFTSKASEKARARLDLLINNKTKPLKMSADELELQAWDETLSLPARYALAEWVTAFLLVVVPTILFMNRIGQASTLQSVHVAIGGLFSATGVVVQNTLFLDRILAPVRQALLPHSPVLENSKRLLQIQTRVLLVIGFMSISTFLMIGSLGYQRLMDAQTAAAAGSLVDLGQYLVQAGILGGLTLAIGFALALQLSHSVSQPIHEMLRAMEQVNQGNVSDRSMIITSDETARLTIQLNQLLNRLQDAQRDLEQKVEERTYDLSRKAVQLQASAQIARDTAAQRDIDSLLARTVDLVSEQFGFYHTGIFLVDDSSDFAILQAASSEGGKRMLERGHRLQIGQGIVGTTARQNKPHIAINVETDLAYFDNPDLPNTRSEAAIPLSVKGKVIGVLDIQSTQPAAFTQEDLGVLQTLADQIALAIQNARLIAESQTAFQRLDAATSEDLRRTWRERVQESKKIYRYTSVGLAPLPVTNNLTSPPGSEKNRLTIPITLRGQSIGNLRFDRKGSSNWTEADRSLAIEIANQVGLALENARLLEAAQRSAAQEQSLNDLTARLSRSLDVDTLLQTALQELHRLPNVTETSVYISPQAASSNTQK